MSTQSNNAAAVAKEIAQIAHRAGDAPSGRALQALAYLAHASALADGAGMLIIERAQEGGAGEGPVFAGLGRSEADALARAPGEGAPAARPGLEDRVRALWRNGEGVLVEAWQSCGEHAWDDTRLGTVSDAVVANDGVRLESTLRRCAARAGAPAWHGPHGAVVRCEGGTATPVRVRPRRGRDVVFTGTMRGQAENRHQRLTLYESEGGTCVVVEEAHYGGGSWEVHEVRSAHPERDPHACAQLAAEPLGRALLESAGPEALFGHVLEPRDPTSQVVWSDSAGRYIGGRIVHRAKVDTRMGTMYKASNGQIAVVSTNPAEGFPHVDIYDDEEDMVSHCGAVGWLRDLCRQVGIDTAVHIA